MTEADLLQFWNNELTDAERAAALTMLPSGYLPCARKKYLHCLFAAMHITGHDSIRTDRDALHRCVQRMVALNNRQENEKKHTPKDDFDRSVDAMLGVGAARKK